VVRPFIADYLAGRTPNPCARCNQHVKFAELRTRTRELGAGLLATGHYARIVRHPRRGVPMVHAAADAGKDQSYFLFMLGANELAQTLFPVGISTKEEVRAEAAQLGLPVAAKPESMDVCFVPRGDAGAFVEREAAATALRPGTIVDTSGAVLGRHDGIHRFTVGQRRGLGLGGGPARYVRRLDAGDATVVVTEAKALTTTRFVVDEVHWTDGEPPDDDARLRVRIRHRHAPMACRVAPGNSSATLVTLEGPGPAVSPGQAAVFYEGEYVLGGGWIVGDAP
jgi:tRNA-specific 2-thiouridylase